MYPHLQEMTSMTFEQGMPISDILNLPLNRYFGDWFDTKMKDDCTINHKLPHVWYGNLVTMSWWDDLWLSKGFAFFLKHKVTEDAILPGCQVTDLFLVEQMHSALATDAELSSHPIVQTVKNIDKVTAIFDEISYKKMFSLIRMMENSIKPTIFENENYLDLKKLMYQNPEAAYLFKILQECSLDNLNVTAITDTWTRQKGFPVVNVKKSGNKYILTQKRFLNDPDADCDPSESEYRYRWTIPITYITNKISTPTLVWFDKDAKDLVIELDDPVEWIKFNAHEVGYYRVNYEEKEWNTLYNILRCQHETLSALDRAHLLEDAFSLAYTGQLDYILVMNMMKYLKREKHPIPWCVASSKLMYIYTLLNDGRIFSKAFRRYAGDLVDNTYREIGWELKEVTDTKSKSYADIRLQKTILEFALAVEHIDCCIATERIFIKYFCGAFEQDQIEYVPANPYVRDLFCYYGMHYFGDLSVWEVVFKQFIAENDRMEKLMLMRTLTAIKDTSILEQFIVTATDEKYVGAQDFLSCLIAMSENPVGTPVVWEWVRSNWEFLVDRYTLTDRHLGSLIPSITKTFATQTSLDEMECFFAKYPDAGAGAMHRAKALETVSNNIKWRARSCDKLGMWLLRYRIEK
ncbi:glutamyl aminopeptidase isoform X3 [Bombus terrestris]|nr:glutamyl aminopeptidase isoform X3 [Bombus terrestris]XP_020718313.2 glutamyl aminopeptidase isoform X3 [Bombus terrestris]XP_020718314.2 glutamyl aminopeptidase isoform X3 [Bombus terrestris]XP_048261364.1 glutamyl aminopeptidase isoform X3 [Bombus terrestris]XP_048261365.1 glutamyl aminopeptidase isoform X3 [Bombus terrestris]